MAHSRAIAVALAAALLAAACTGGDSEPEPPLPGGAEATLPEPVPADPPTSESARDESPAPIPEPESEPETAAKPEPESDPGPHVDGEPEEASEPATPEDAADVPGGGFIFGVGRNYLVVVAEDAYILPGPAGGVPGALRFEEVFPWKYDFSTGMFEQDGATPSKPFDPSIRDPSRDWEIAWVSGWSDLPNFQAMEDSIRAAAAASGIHIGSVCDSEFDAERAVACAEAIAASPTDAVIFGNLRGEAAGASMEVFDTARIPVITPDIAHPNAILLGADDYAVGAIAGVNTGVYALNSWDCEDVHVLLAQSLTTDAAQDRNSGYADGVQAVCGADVPVSRIGYDGSGESVLASTVDWLVANPGVRHVLATGPDDVAVAMSRALQQAERSGVAAGHSTGTENLQRLAEESAAQTRYLGSAAHTPNRYGSYLVAALIDVLEGRSVPQEIHTDYVWTTRAGDAEYRILTYLETDDGQRDADYAEPEAEPERTGPSEPPGGDFVVTVAGVDYALPGTVGGILGALPPDEVFPWTYNFDTATFEAGSSPAAPFDPSIPQAARDYEIAFVSGWAALEWSQYVRDSVERTASASGVHVGAICDSEFDPERALTCAQRIVASEPHAVVFGNWRSEAAESSMRVFDDAGIPVITLDVWHPNAVFFGADNYVAGAIAGINSGLYALETWNCAGVHVLLAQNLTAGEAPDLRTSGFADGVQAVCGGHVPVSRIDVDGSPEGAFAATNYWLAENPNAEHVLAASLDDVVAVPMSRAMEEAGRSGVAAGHGAEPNGLRRMYDGPASETRYLGSVAYFPDLYGVYAVAALIDILEGRAVPQEIRMDHVWIDRDNVDQYYDFEGVPVHNLGPPAPPRGPSAEADRPSEPPGGVLTPRAGGGYVLTLNSGQVAVPGPAGRIPGGLPPDEIFPWTYDFATGLFEAGGSPAAPFDPATRQASVDYEIAWVSGWAALEFSRYMHGSIQRAAAASGVRIGTVCDSEFDAAKAVACAETVAASDADAVIFANWRSEVAESAMAVFDDARMPVITTDLWHPNAVLFSADNYVAGAMAGVNAAFYVLQTGLSLENWNCESVHILLAEYGFAGDEASLRTSGFADGVQAICGGEVPVSRIEVDGSAVSALQSTTDWLDANPDAEHVLAAGPDDLAAVPISQALQLAERSGVVAGQGAEVGAIRRMHEGPPEETRFLGSVAYLPELYGQYVVAALIDILEGRPVPQEIHMDHVWIDHRNADLYYDIEGAPIHSLGR